MHLSRRTTSAALAAALTLLVGGCGSAVNAGAAPASRNAGPVPGTRPSPSDPPSRTPRATPAVTPTSLPTDVLSLQVLDPGGDYLSAADDGPISVVEIGIHGVGRVWPTGDATLRRTASGAVLRYHGGGTVDPHASLSVPFDPAPATETRHARIRVVASTRAGGLGQADVWIDGRHYRLASREAPRTADAVVRIVLDDVRAHDWSDLYDHAAPVPGLSRERFVRQLSGSLSRIRVLGPTTYRTHDGVAFADTPVHVDASLHGTPLHVDGALVLVFRNGAWLYSTLTSSASAR